MTDHRNPTTSTALPWRRWTIVLLIASSLLALLYNFLYTAPAVASAPQTPPRYSPRSQAVIPTIVTTTVNPAQANQATFYISKEEASSRAIVDTQDDGWRAAVQGAQSCNNFQTGILSETVRACGATKTGECINPTAFAGNQVISYTLRNMVANGPPLGNPDAWSSGQGDGCGPNGTDLQDGAPRPTGLAGCYYNDAANLRGDTNSPNAVLFTFQQPVNAFGAWFGDLETKAPGTNYYHTGKEGGTGSGGALAYLRLFFEDGTMQQMPITATLAPVTTWLSKTAPPPTALVGSGGDIGLCGGTDDPTDADGCGNETTRWVGFVTGNPSNRVKQMLVAVGDDDHSGSGPSNGPNVLCSGGNANTCNGGTEFLSFIGPTLCIAPDLTINKAGQPDPVVAGSVVTYTLRYTNLVTSIATGVVTVTDYLPSGATYFNTVASNPPATLLNSSPQWRVASLPANSSGTITFTAQIGVNVAGVITNTATVATPGDLNLSNNQAHKSTLVLQPKATLVVNKVVINDHGGTALTSDFPLFLNGQHIDNGVTITVPTGVYTITESNLGGYIGSFSGDCSASGVIYLQPGDQKTCTLTNNDPPPTLGVLIVQKVVVNDAGGSATVNDFPLFVNEEAVNSNVENLLPPGSYVISEQNLPGYAATFSGDCAADGTLTLAAGERKRCILTNDDIAPTLTVHKVVVNDDEGDATIADFPLWVGETAVTSGVTVTLPVGDYRVSEHNRSGYAAAFGGDCLADGSVTLRLGDHQQCTITNNDLPPVLATLTVRKVVVNDHGGTAQVADFPLFVSGQSVLSGVAQVLKPGSYLITETNAIGYAATLSGDCAADGSITLNAGESKICTLTNDDIAPTLTVHKVVVNDNNGTATATDFPLWINRNAVGNGAVNVLAAGVYTVSETNRPGYAATLSGDCGVNGSVTLALGEAKSCTITNNDLPPALGILTVQKVVVNDHGGSALATDFPLTVNDQAVINGADNLLPPGVYQVKEVNQPGYAATFSGDCTADGQVTLAAGEHKHCILTNNDIAPTLTLHKSVINDHGGIANVLDFPLFVDDLRVTSGVTTPLTAGLYTVHENDLLGYVGRIAGDCAPDGRVQLQLGEAKHCTLVNDDLPPSLGILTVRKVVVNDHGGSARVSDFPLAVNGQAVVSGVEKALPPGIYTVSEHNLPGYQASFSGDCASDGSVTVTANGTSICTIVNDDIAPTLVVEKVVSNDDGGRAVVSDFPLFVGQQVVVSGAPTTLLAGEYTVGERGLPGYVATFSGDCAADGRVALALGVGKRCIITNDDQFASLGDRVWYDRDLDGQQTANEPGIAGVTVRLYDTQGSLISTTVTGPAGDYLFRGLLPGDFVVAFDKAADFVFTLPDQGEADRDSDVNPDSGRTGLITLGPSEHRRAVDAGLYQLAALGNFVWHDLNQNGVQDSNEPGLGGVWITLYDANQTVVGITQSNTQGYYGFTDLAPGAYTLKFELPPEYRFTAANQTDEQVDSDVDPSTGVSEAFRLGPNDVNLTAKAGIVAYPLLRLEKLVSHSRLEITSTATAILTYTLVYSNAGLVPASGVVLTEHVPPATTFYAAASTPGWQCADGASAGTTCLFAIGPLLPKQKGQVIFALTIPSSSPGNLTVTNLAALQDDGANTTTGLVIHPRQASAHTDVYAPTSLAESAEPDQPLGNQLFLPLIEREKTAEQE